MRGLLQRKLPLFSSRVIVGRRCSLNQFLVHPTANTEESRHLSVDYFFLLTSQRKEEKPLHNCSSNTSSQPKEEKKTLWRQGGHSACKLFGRSTTDLRSRSHPWTRNPCLLIWLAASPRLKWSFINGVAHHISGDGVRRVVHDLIHSILIQSRLASPTAWNPPHDKHQLASWSTNITSY